MNKQLLKKEVREEVKDVLNEREEQRIANSPESRYWDKVYVETWRREMEAEYSQKGES